MIFINTVEPIRDMQTVNYISQYLMNKNHRNYILWLVGIYTGLRVSDILRLRVSDVKSRDRIYTREKKTGKENFVPIPDELKSELEKYIKGKKEFMFLFPSRKKIKKNLNKNETISLEQPLSRNQVYYIINQACKHFGLTNVGTHTMRKTFGYFLYQNTKDIVLVKEILNHSDIAITRRYIGLTYETKQNALKNISYR